jgi:thiol-disulfide isomerase/thioredoxin
VDGSRRRKEAGIEVNRQTLPRYLVSYGNLNRSTALLRLRRWALLGAILLFASALRAELKVGDMFPSLTDAGLVGKLPPTTGQVVLVDFWASWCAPCKASFPSYSKLQTEFAPRGLVIVAVGVDENASAFDSFVKKLNPSFPVVHDRAMRLVSTVKVPTMPTSYLLDRTGKVRVIHVGFHGSETETELRKEIEGLLAEKE